MCMTGMARRLAVMESRLCGSNANDIVFIQMSVESREAMEERIDRWYH